MYFQSSASQEHCHNLGPVSWWQVAIHHYGVRDWRMSERLSQSTRSYADLASPRQNGELFHYFVMASLSQSDEFLYFFLRALLCQNDELFHYFVMTSPCQNGGTFTNLWNYLSVYIEVHWYFHQSVNHLDAYINFRYIGTFTSLLIIYLFIFIQPQFFLRSVCLAQVQILIWLVQVAAQIYILSFDWVFADFSVPRWLMGWLSFTPQNHPSFTGTFAAATSSCQTMMLSRCVCT